MAEHRLRLVVAFGVVYVVWGSTYLGIRFAIETLPPFMMAGTRFLGAGAILYIWARLRGVAAPTRANWIAASIVGVLLLVGGNGGVVWATQYIPSGLAAVLVATVPLWIVLLDWARPGGHRPTPVMIAGLLSGVLGVALLVGPGEIVGGGRVDLAGAAAVVAASLAWALGSLYTSRGVMLPSSPALATALEMVAGGSVLLGVGASAGEWHRLDPAAVSLKSLLALAYLLLFGAVLGFTAYIYLLKNTTPARASTYAYVNPIIAVGLGWAVGGESLSPRALLATGAVVAAVVLITFGRASAGPGPSAALHLPSAAETPAGGDQSVSGPPSLAFGPAAPERSTIPTLAGHRPGCVG